MAAKFYFCQTIGEIGSTCDHDQGRELKKQSQAPNK